MAKVLVVDDEKSVRFALQEYLGEDDHDVYAAGSVDEAIALLKDDEFDVVVTDIVMPRVSGIEMLRKIREFSPDIQVVMITGEPNVLTAAEAVRSGAFDYVSKPLSREGIRKIVSRAVKVKALSDDKKRLEVENRNYQEHLEELVEERTTALEVERVYFESLFENAPEAVVLADNDGRIRKVNGEFTRLFGYTSGEAMGRPVDLLIVPEDTRENGISMTKKTLMGERREMEAIRKRKDGTLLDASIVSSPVLIKKEQVGVYGIYRDITDRKNAEKVLKRRTHDLSERVKELNCLYGISEILQRDDISLDEILQGTVDVIPSGWQFPDFAGARILMDGRDYRTENFSEGMRSQSADIKISGLICGAVEVHYLDSMPECDEGPFIREERNLMEAIAERVGKIAERFKARERIDKERAKRSNVVVNTSHLIHTPLTVIKGHMELVKNGKKEMTPELLEKLLSKVKEMNRLITHELHDKIELMTVETSDGFTPSTDEWGSTK